MARTKRYRPHLVALMLPSYMLVCARSFPSGGPVTIWYCCRTAPRHPTGGSSLAHGGQPNKSSERNSFSLESAGVRGCSFASGFSSATGQEPWIPGKGEIHRMKTMKYTGGRNSCQFLVVGVFGPDPCNTILATVEAAHRRYLPEMRLLFHRWRHRRRHGLRP